MRKNEEINQFGMGKREKWGVEKEDNKENMARA